MTQNYNTSNKLLKRALNVIPMGAQTFSKSHILYPKDTSPLFLTRGKGSIVWDVDGNQYIDCVNGLLANLLGYCDPYVNDAISKQLKKGISFSLATELEVELAEKLCSIIPSAQKVQFAKNGTDVTSAAIRVARAYTKREKIITCGYHGWQDWYVGKTSRNKGVPKAVSSLTSIIPYNDLSFTEKLLKTEKYAAIIIEPCNIEEPDGSYLQELKSLCEKYGSLLIFDEIITGFRFSLGGAQELFGVTPHLSCFGKGMGNGMPISALVGQDFVMKEVKEIFFSGTFGGETLSLAAALAVISKIEKENVVDFLWSFGKDLSNKIQAILQKYNFEEQIKLLGMPPWKIIQFVEHPNASKEQIKALFTYEMIQKGILMNGSFNLCYAHCEIDKQKILKAFDETIKLLSEVVLKKEVEKVLSIPLIEPVFKVR